MSNTTIPDLAERRRALAPDASFIVQAPAGSGKTELLIQRMLVLLAIVERPEEIAAITFTKKAAAEMKKRVFAALSAARNTPRPEGEDNAHKAMTWDLARAALARNDAKGWQLEASASRLRVQTIDALCASLTRQMPVLARFGAQPESVEDARELYLEAARNTLALLDAREAAADDVAHLLTHLDNSAGIAAELIAGMLARRDHWLRNLIRNIDGAGSREALEAALADIRRTAVRRVRALMPAPTALELTAPAGDDDAEGWAEIATELLTQKGEWRKRNKLAQTLSELEDLRAALVNVQLVPSAHYSTEQWAALGAITRLLPRAVAELKLVFALRGKADFVEISQGALLALGTEDAPTDLLLSLDYRIHHILVDEFQDTSFSQYELLQRLTSGWAPDDGRTLFVVGDPMQSIYRFREAEVGLFLRARHEGIGNVELEALTLSTNFRSQADIVNWVNEAFEQVMPASENIAEGAVTYAPSEAVHPAEADAVTVHPFFGANAAGEAEQVAVLVRNAQSEHPEGTVAVLVRGRSHLAEIVPQLRVQGLAFRAIEIEPLGHRQVVQDLLALTRALGHTADRLAWLAILRAPWCGLTLADLHALAGTDAYTPSPSPQPSPARGEGVAMRGTGTDAVSTSLSPSTGERTGERVLPAEQDEDALNAELRALNSEGTSPEKPRQARVSSLLPSERTVWELMHDAARLAALSPDGLARLTRTRAVLEACLAQRFRASLRDAVEGAWLALGGPACVSDATDLEDAGIYLDHLEDAEEAGAIADPVAFEETVAKLYALPDLAASERLQIMTIHKAKGLEFDTVIVPALGRGTGRDERQLFMWMETTDTSNSPGNAVTSNSPNNVVIPDKAAGRDPESMGSSASGHMSRHSGAPQANPEPMGYSTSSKNAVIPDKAAGRDPESMGLSTPGKLLLAPVNPTGSDKDPIYEAIRRLDQDKASHESGRLLYVAATRAKHHLHLLGDVRLDTKDDTTTVKPPSRGSLLSKLWPAVSDQFEEAAQMNPPAAESSDADSASVDQQLRRLPTAWQLPTAPTSVTWTPPELTARTQDEIEFSWSGEVARHVGSVVHRWLQRIAEEGVTAWSAKRVDAMQAAIRDELAAHGVEETQLPAAAARVGKALTNALTDERGRWLLGPQTEARNEYRLTSLSNGERRNLVIDRTFKDAEGKLWIVDYKTSSHEGADREGFLDREQARYRAQLERYAEVHSAIETRLGLYFPLLGGWREWKRKSDTDPV